MCQQLWGELQRDELWIPESICISFFVFITNLIVIKADWFLFLRLTRIVNYFFYGEGIFYMLIHSHTHKQVRTLIL